MLDWKIIRITRKSRGNEGKEMSLLSDLLVSKQIREVLMALLESASHKYKPIDIINDTSKTKGDLLPSVTQAHLALRRTEMITLIEISLLDSAL